MLRERRGFSNYPSPLPADSASKPRSGAASEEITIRFVGDMQENISEVVRAIRCGESAREQFGSILRIYAGKIAKLREERDFYRELLCLSEEKQGEEIDRLRAQVALLQEQADGRLKNNCERCTCFDESDFQTSKFSEHPEGSLSRATLRSFANRPPAEDEILIESSRPAHSRQDSLQVSQTGEASISEEELGRLMMKYNINTEELEQILEEYDRENRQAYELFDSERQRQLYRLGQRMQKDLWNKKVIKDIKKISEKR